MLDSRKETVMSKDIDKEEAVRRVIEAVETIQPDTCCPMVSDYTKYLEPQPFEWITKRFNKIDG